MSIIAGKSRLILAATGCILAAAYALSAGRLHTPAFSDPMGPRAVPFLIAIGLAVSCVALVVEHLAIGRKSGTSAVPADAGDSDDGLTFIAVLTLGLLVGYYFLLERLGFIASTAIFLLVFLSVTNRRRWLMNVLIAVLFPLAAYLLLSTLLGARLPVGIFEIG